MTEIKKENEQLHEDSSSIEILKGNEQMHEEGSSKKRKIPRWISTKDKIDINSTDLVDLVLLHILERLKKYPDDDWFSMISRRVYVNNVPMGDHKPILVSIGPKHRDTIKSDLMEFYKLNYTTFFFERTNNNLEQFLRANLDSLTSLVEMCTLFDNWSDPDDVSMGMFILDGCFIIELFLRNVEPWKGDADFLYRSESVQYALSRDLILPDNQLPLEVLNILFEMSGVSVKFDQHDGDHLKLSALAFKFLERIVPNQKLDHTLVDIDRPYQNLLSIVYDGLSWLRPEAKNNYKSNIDKDEKDGDDKWNLVKSATELQEFGVEFKMIETDNFNFVDIKFTNKVLKIPRIRIRYGTPYCIKVLLEHEQSSNYQSTCLNNYLWFMNSLVKSPNDVQLLRQKEIIDNLSELPDDAAIHRFLKDFYESLMISRNDFSYVQVCRDLNLHCNHRRNIWMAKFKRDYFNSPWAVISFFAASLLLILTITQTVFSIASYYNQD